MAGALLVFAALAAALVLMREGRFYAPDQPAVRLGYGALLGFLGVGAGLSALRRLRSWREGFAQGRFGSAVMHGGFALLLLGGFLTAWKGLTAELSIQEGETVTLPGTPVRLVLEKFSAVPYPSQPQTKEYVSRLRVVEPGGGVRWVSLGVNEPAAIHGVRLYQMRYNQSVERLILSVWRAGSKEAQRIELEPGRRAALPGIGAVEVLDVVPDFAMSEQGVVSRSLRFSNPAARVAFYDSLEAALPSSTEWAFRGFDAPHPSGSSSWRARIERLQVRYRSGIKAVRDPGMGVAYLGLALLVAGAFMACAGAPQRSEFPE